MINYSNYDDTQINMLVSGGGKYKDYCGNWADAGKMMEDNNISLLHIYAMDEWEASTRGGDIKLKVARSVNPKRAISECYLMMKESKK